MQRLFGVSAGRQARPDLFASALSITLFCALPMKVFRRVLIVEPAI